MLLVPSQTSSSYSVYPTYPPLDLLGFNPASNPDALYPPPADRSLARPFDASPEIYETLLHPALPISIAIIYAGTVSYVNRLNKERDHKPWSFSTTLPFYILVIAHNVGLTIFSGWTFLGMLNAITNSWPGWDGEYGLVGAVDALCKINGPRGLGSAATYNMTTASWGFTDRAIKLSGRRPDSSDVGRIWNEGLAYYGFFFYLSKLYEIVDTAIILAKGKESSNLQTFHHAGAMLCLWAGIRYMSPPIWMFTFINSGLHTLMYTYYTLSALTIHIPPVLKRTLTTLQIIQIFFGTSYALLHLFIAYEIPASTPYVFAKNLSSALPSVASTISTAGLSLATSLDYVAWFKKAALRAAGEEGLAENVRNYRGETFGIDAVHAAQVEKAQEEIRYRLTTRNVHCLDTSGQVFAILLNAVYLLPLAVLFCEFFYKAYMKRAQQDPPKPATPENIKKSAQEAVAAIEAKIKKAIDDTQGGITKAPPDVQAQLDDLHTKSKQIVKSADDAVRNKGVQVKDSAQQDLEKMQEKLKSLQEKGEEVGEKAIKKIQDAAGDLPANAKKGAEQVQEGAQSFGSKAKDAGGKAMETIGKVASDITQGAQEGFNKGLKAAKDKAQAAKDEAKDAADGADQKVEETGKDAEDMAADVKEGAQDTGRKGKDEIKVAASKSSKEKDDPVAKASENKAKPADQSSGATKDLENKTGEGPAEKKEPHANGQADETAKESTTKIEGKDSKDEIEKDHAKTSTEDVKGDKDNGNPEKVKKDKKDGKKGNWWSKK